MLLDEIFVKSLEMFHFGDLGGLIESFLAFIGFDELSLAKIALFLILRLDDSRIRCVWNWAGFWTDEVNSFGYF